MDRRWDKDARRVADSEKAQAWKLAGLLIAAGLVVGAITMAVTANVYKNSLRTRVHTIAESLDSRQIMAARSDAVGAIGDNAYLKTKLARIKDANADSRSVYLILRDTNGNVYYLADSEVAGTPGYSRRGTSNPQASPAVKAAFDNGRLLVEGPARDSNGNWLSALAPVIDGTTYKMTAIVGMDIPATTYGLLLGLAGGTPLLLAICAAAIVFGRQQGRHRHDEHVQFRAEMLSIASHELRTPLTGLRWSEESLLSQKMTTPAQQHMVEIMYDITRRLQESIEDILQLASLESGKAQRLLRKESDLRTIINDVIDMQHLAAERNHIDIALSAEWPKELLVDCDVQRIKRVFNNTISNAVKYSKPGGKIVIGYARPSEACHRITIQDHGIGIPQAEQSKVWQGFYRAKNTADHNVSGTGMGLYLAHSIVEQHGGRMSIDSTENEGTTVSIELPA